MNAQLGDRTMVLPYLFLRKISKNQMRMKFKKVKRKQMKGYGYSGTTRRCHQLIHRRRNPGYTIPSRPTGRMRLGDNNHPKMKTMIVKRERIG
ncbi:hypothetical protein BG011_008140 [Mortierella polycephala]|uniref:Ribosomal protein L2 n=1 Tax=Mortierella polycephala TaxID=41804 RepID=A0A9P6PRU0_9FUNG|nr:hypothetical protein BG011_008140 [Mortierella polycephala]